MKAMQVMLLGQIRGNVAAAVCLHVRDPAVGQKDLPAVVTAIAKELTTAARKEGEHSAQLFACIAFGVLFLIIPHMLCISGTLLSNRAPAAS